MSSEASVDEIDLAPELADLDQSIAPLARALNQLELEQYGMLVGEDTSGRIPTLIVRHAINGLRQRRGERKIPTFFVQTTDFIHSDEERIGEEAAWETRAAALGSVGGRALVVTDYIDKGYHIRNLIKRLSNLHIPADVVAVQSGFTEMELRNLQMIPAITRVVMGHRGWSEHPLFCGGGMSGLNREKFASPMVCRDPVSRRQVVASRVNIPRAGAALTAEIQSQRQASLQDVGQATAQTVQ